MTLDIKKRRADGYHEIESVMQSVGFFDTVQIERDSMITVGCSDTRLCSESNLAHRAAEFFIKTADVNGGAKITIEKRIPVAAGLAGGSADAAAVIVGLDRLFDTRLEIDRLSEIGLAVGADVPFCIRGGTMLAQGVGEHLSKLPALPDCFIVIVKSGEKTSTGRLYSEYDKIGEKTSRDVRPMLVALGSESVEAVGARLFNAFEKVVPQSGAAKQQMLDYGALGAALSGSGPAVFGIFSDVVAAASCAQRIGKAAHVCKPSACGCEIIGTA